MKRLCESCQEFTTPDSCKIRSEYGGTFHALCEHDTDILYDRFKSSQDNLDETYKTAYKVSKIEIERLHEAASKNQQTNLELRRRLVACDLDKDNP